MSLLFAGNGGAQPVNDGARLSCRLEGTMDWIQLCNGQCTFSFLFWLDLQIECVVLAANKFLFISVKTVCGDISFDLKARRTLLKSGTVCRQQLLILLIWLLLACSSLRCGHTSGPDGVFNDSF